jgi:hypothetical protein
MKPEVGQGRAECPVAATILRLSCARMMLWTKGEVPEHLRTLWQQAQEEIPDWPGFQRLQIGPREYAALEGLDEEIASLERFMAEHYSTVRSGKDRDGLWIFGARAGWFLRMLNRMGLHGLRSWWMWTRQTWWFWVLTAAGTLLFGVFTIDWLDVRGSSAGAVVSGKVVAHEPGPIYMLHRRLNVRIAVEGSTNIVTATIAPYLRTRLPQAVRFHYSGDPTGEVFLHEVEPDPRWHMLLALGFVVAGVALSCIVYRQKGVV